MRFLLWEGQSFGAEIIDFLFVVKGFQGSEVDALEDGAQGFLLIGDLFLFAEDLLDAGVQCLFGIRVRFELHSI